MCRSVVVAMFSVFVFTLAFPSAVSAQVQVEDYQNDELAILFLYSTPNNEKNGNVKKIDMLIRHFANNVRVVSEQKAQPNDFATATHVVYYGEKQKQIKPAVLSAIDAFSGPVLAIGENAEQISRFSSLDFASDEKMNGVSTDRREIITIPPSFVKRIESLKEADVWLYGHRGEDSFPIFVQISPRDYYFAATSFIDSVVGDYFADLLHDIFPNDHPRVHLAYLRLEDIHPLTDPKKLLEVGEYLIERNIPFLLVVIPVYIAPETGEKVHFSESPKLIEILRYLQDNGGVIIAHGYTHQYRESETGEGFEFWDVENDQMIISADPEAEVERIKTRDYFANGNEYDRYMENIKQKERAYIEERLRDSIHELVRYGLYPLGFEPPHYTMSQQGYSIVSEYFSSFFGKLQLEDHHWKVMDSPPFVTTGEQLNQMTIYPERIGFVNPTLPNAIQRVTDQIQRSMIVRDGVIGGFYHPYLGLEYLRDLVSAIEAIPNVEWLDVKRTRHRVASDRVDIVSSKTGEVSVKSDLTWQDDWKVKQLSLSMFEKILWGVTLIAFLFVCLFFGFTVFLRTRIKKRLFRERNTFGE